MVAGVENSRFEITRLPREVYANVSNAVQVDAKVILKTLRFPLQTQRFREQSARA
jgi:hypothetical protein